MELDDDACPSSGSGGGSQGRLTAPSVAALQAVAVPQARRRSGSRASPGVSSASQQHSSGDETRRESADDSDVGCVPVPEAEVAAVMQRYRSLQQEFVDRQLALGPVLIPDNQAMLEARMAELLHQRRGRRLEAAQPTAAAAAAAAATAATPTASLVAAAAAAAAPAAEPAAAAATEAAPGAADASGRNADAAAGKLKDVLSAAAAAAAASGTSAAAAAAAAAAGRGRPRARAVTFSSNEGKSYSRKAFRLAYEQRLPEYFSWGYLARSELAVEHGQRMFYTDETGETVPASDDEDADQKPWTGPNGPSHDYALTQLAQEYRGQGRLQHLLSALEVGLEQDSEAVTAGELAARLAFLAEQATPKLPPTEQDRRSGSFNDSMQALHANFCRRCNIYSCRLHGGKHVQPAQPPPPPAPPVDAPPCGSGCWRLLDQQPGAVVEQQQQQQQQQQRQPGAAAEQQRQQQQQQQGQEQPEMLQQQQAQAVPELTEYERGCLQQGLQTFGCDPCKLALLLLDRSCAQVHAYLAAVPLQADEAAETAQAAVGRRKAHPKKNCSGLPARKRVATKRYNLSPDDLPPYTPCTCAGPCQPATCSCIQSNNWCEKFCACVSCKTRDCTFLGCSCLTQCRTERCPCLAAGRECDPEVCRGCTPTALGNAPPERACCNMGLRLRKHARIYMGLSSVSGWGAFLGRSAAKDDFLGEYVGELLSQAEADRRGKAYDRGNNSYLFGVNSAWVLDARERGNNVRFANHRSKPNCQTRVLMVDGDHRVGLFAVKDIAEGEELFYNYRYDLDNAPDWAICS